MKSLKVMKKEFVPYELALKLKALGFDEPCFGYYTGDILCVNQPKEIHLDKDGNYKKSKTESYPLTKAPTFSQAFRYILGFSPLNKWNTNIALYYDGTYSIKSGKDSTHEYLSAESCLEKLIEIVEQQVA